MRGTRHVTPRPDASFGKASSSRIAGASQMRRSRRGSQRSRPTNTRPSTPAPVSPRQAVRDEPEAGGRCTGRDHADGKKLPEATPGAAQRAGVLDVVASAREVDRHRCRNHDVDRVEHETTRPMFVIVSALAPHSPALRRRFPPATERSYCGSGASRIRSYSTVPTWHPPSV